MTRTGTAPQSTGVRLDPVEVDLLCTFAQAEPPFPLDIPSAGTTELERQALLQAAGHRLAARGLADARGPVGVAGAFARLLRVGTGTVYLVLAAGERTLGAVALVDEQRAVLATQSPEQPHVVALTELRSDDAVPELEALVPRVAAAGSLPCTLPLDPIRELFDQLCAQHRADGAALSQPDLDDLLWRLGIDEQVVRRMADLRQVVGSGQTGATRRTGSAGWQRIGAETRWLDTGRGRFALAEHTGTDGVAWVSVNPLSRQDLRATLRELALAAREP